MIKLNGEPINITMFSDKTSQVWKVDLEGDKYIEVYWDFENEAEFMHLAQLKDLLDYHGFEVSLTMPYLPYARQDKPISNETTFALYTFAKLLNTLNFDEVIVVDAHSEVPELIIKNLVDLPPIGFLHDVRETLKPDVTAYPDQNAYDKYVGNPLRRDYVYGKKVRNQLTGHIDSYELVSTVNLNNKSVLIQDDLADGGMTFILLAKELYKNGAKEVNLFTTHGIYSKGLQVLKDAGIKRIFNRNGEM